MPIPLVLDLEIRSTSGKCLFISRAEVGSVCNIEINEVRQSACEPYFIKTKEFPAK